MIEQTRGQVVIVADSSKAGVVADLSIAPIEAASILVTDAGLDDEYRLELTALGVQVVVADDVIRGSDDRPDLREPRYARIRSPFGSDTGSSATAAGTRSPNTSTWNMVPAPPPDRQIRVGDRGADRVPDAAARHP